MLSLVMKLQVDPIQRYAKMRAHTATHLLHAQLAAIFPQTKQAGSLVDEDYLRFDFYADNLLTEEQITSIETNINTIIQQAMAVDTQEMSYKDATKSGAKAFFEDKYGDTVRVVKVKSNAAVSLLDKGGARRAEDLGTTEAGGICSIELCGWTHVTNTKDIGAFVIVSQEAVASGIKRMTALTGPKVLETIHEQRSIINNIANKFSVPVKQLLPKIDKDQNEFLALRNQFESVVDRLVREWMKWTTRKNIDDMQVIHLVESWLLWSLFEYVIKYILSNNEEQEVIVTQDSWKYLIKSKAGKAKFMAQKHNLKGGWSDSLFQGKDPKILDILN